MINEIKGKGLFVFSDPGGAKPILSFIYNEKVNNYMVISDRKYNFFSDFDINVETYDLNKEKEIINEYNPDYIFTGTSYKSKIELKFISEALKLGIKTYTFIDHYTNYKERFFINDRYIYPDTIFLTDLNARKIAIEAELNIHSDLKVSGNFFHFFLKKWKPNISRENLIPLEKINSKKKIILFAPDPLSNINNKITYSFDESDVWKDLSTAFSNVFINNPPILIVKYHPNQNINYLKKAIKKFPVNNCFCTDSIDTNTLIYHADIVIGMFSNILVEAQIFKKEILRHIPNTKFKDPLKQSKVGQISNDLKGLVRNLKLLK